ncbi:uncharacterized protein LOC133347890 isoform X1 [Lethenteron reissneri]|uniref:uncharacterized protein LOC133347890 isoform X1 n=1 Tax=Lethenteron reissneri TaxID=7753 RepID=UPI002AB637B0|nr:uncharacterized protein LOC133347890 isoform X1 [Lethenteron reissneri]
MSQGIWKLYKSKSMKTLVPDREDDARLSTCKPKDGRLLEDVSTSVSQFATKVTRTACTALLARSLTVAIPHAAHPVQGARLKGWKDVTSLFSAKHSDHERLTETHSPLLERATRAQQDAADNNVGGKEFWNNFGRKPRARERSGNQCSPTKGDPPQWPPEADEDGGNDWEQQTTQTQRSWGKRREAEGKFLRSSSWDILDSDFGEREGGKKGGTGRDTHPPRIKGGGGGNRGQRQGLVDSKEGKAAEAEDEEGWGEWGWRPIK